MRLYTATTPNGRKISIALEELGLQYDTEWVHLDKEEQLSSEFLALNPNHKIPVLEDDGQVIWESGAILLHLGEQHDPDGIILPKDPKTRMDAIQQKSMAASNLRTAEQALINLEEALSKLDQSDFGLCVRCSKRIPLERILIVPESKCCVQCA